MTAAQRTLRTKWLIAGTVFCILVLFNDFMEQSAGWIRWIFLAGAFLAALGEKRSRSEMRQEASANLESLAESAPWLKAWFAFWAVTFFLGAIYVTRNSIDVFHILGLRFLLISFALLVGPLAYLGERRRFRELGEVRDAI
jgi:hypothetical protein